MTDLRQCSRCKCSILLETYFSKNRKGEYNKTCNSCRSKVKKRSAEIREQNKDNFKCTVEGCGVKCSTTGNLNQHNKLVHDKIKDFECPNEECDYKCSGGNTLRQHIKAVHERIKNFECQSCDTKFATSGNLKQHIKTVHDKIKDFVCSVEGCNAKFSGKSDLKVHIKRVHDKNTDFECDKCDYKCSTNAGFKQHIKTVHDKIKDFVCSVEGCNAKFSTKPKLREHVTSVHDKIKDFKCEDCDYKCSSKGNLRRHIKICTGELKCSAGEFAVMKVLDEMKVEYVYDSTYELKNDDDNYLRWDFVVKTDSEPLFIEYDGRQHFIPVKYFGGEENFKKQQQHDKLKNEYCEDNGFNLLRISYKDFGSIPKMVSDFIIANTDWGFE